MIVIDLPWTNPPLSQNDRDERNRGGARKIATAKEQAAWAIKAAKPPRLIGAHLTLALRPATKRRRDADNLGPTLKVCSDALVQCGVIPDDSWVHVPTATCRIDPPNGQPAAMWIELVPTDDKEAA